MRSGGGGQTLGAGAPAGIDKPLHFELPKSFFIKSVSPGLRVAGFRPAAVPVETKPAQILRQRLAGAGGVEVLHTEDQLAAERTAVQPGQQHRQQIARMQIARGAWRETPDDGGHQDFLVRMARIAMTKLMPAASASATIPVSAP